MLSEKADGKMMKWRGENPSPSQQAKAAGLKSLRQVAQITKQSEQTLSNWHKHKPDLFRIVLLGCLEDFDG